MSETLNFTIYRLIIVLTSTGINNFFFSALPGREIGEILSSYPEDNPPQLRVTLKKTTDIQVINEDLNEDDHFTN